MVEDKEAVHFFEAALEAQANGEYERALFELDRAWRLKRDYRFLYQRVLVLEAMGRQSMALELLEANRDALIETEEITDFFVVEERLRTSKSMPFKDIKSDAAPSTPPGRSTLDLVGPIALGLVGAAFTLWGLTLFGDSCELEARSGQCLRGEEADTPLAIGVTSIGGVAVVGAVVWFIYATPSGDEVDSVSLLVAPGGLRVAF